LRGAIILFLKLRARQRHRHRFSGKKNRTKNRLTLVLKKNQATIRLQQVHRRQNVANKRLLNLNLEMVEVIKRS
jgi:hypothetical protein